jgi:hypothetical protein
MEKRILQKFNENMIEFKSRILEEISKGHTLEETIEWVQQCEPIPLERADFVKRRRTKNSVPPEERCNAKSAKNDQCTRRRKNGHTCCGTHSKGVPHGLMSTDDSKSHQKEVWAEDINGIIYYLDADHNVYKTEDIMKNMVNPTILAKWSKVGDLYTIHWTF